MGFPEEEGLIRDDSGLLLEDSGARSTPRRHQYCNKLTNTLILASAFFALGLCVAIPGPTLLDLGDQVKETTSRMMIVFAARSLGYLFGALIGGLLFDCFDRQLLLFTTLLLSAVAMAAIPWSLTLGVMATMFALQGVSMGVLDTGGNVFCIQLWGKQNGPYIQTLHFAFGIGAFIAPLLAKPFLSPDHTMGGFQNSTELNMLNGNVPVSTNLHHQISGMINVNRSHRAKKWLEGEGMYAFDESGWNSGNTALAVREKRYVEEDSESLSFKGNLEMFQKEINKLKDLRYSQRRRRVPDERDSQNDFWKWKRNNSRRLVRQANAEDSVTPPLESIEGNGESTSMVITTKSVSDLDNTDAGHQNDTSVKPANASVASVPPEANATTTAVNTTLSTTTVVPQTSTQIVSPSIPTEKRPQKPSAATDNDRNQKTAEGFDKHTMDNHIQTALKNDVNQNQQKPAGDGGIAKQNGSVSNNTTIAPSASSNLTNSSETVGANMTTVSQSTIARDQPPGTPVAKPIDGQVTSTARPPAVQPSTSAATPSTQAPPTTPKPTTTTTTTPAPTTQKPTTTPSPTTTLKPTTTTISTTTTTTTTTTRPTTQQPPMTEKPTTSTTQTHISVTAPKTNFDVNKGDSDPDMTQRTENVTKPMTAVDNFNQVVKNLSRIQIAYIIVGLLLFLNSVLVLVMYCRRKGLLADMGNEEYLHPPVVKMCYKASFLLLLGVFFFIYVGLEVSYGALITTFAVNYKNWPKEQGATVAAIFWGSLATGRGFSIFIANCCGPSIMLVIDLVFMLIGSLILSFALGLHDKILWLGTLILGLGMSSVFPAGISWAEKYIPLSGKSTAVFVIGSAMGQMVIPSFIGFLYEKLGNMVLMRSTFALSLLLTLLYVFVHFVARKVSGQASSVNRNGFMPLESDDIDDENLEMDMVHYERGATRKRKQVKLDGNDAQYHVLVSDLEDD